MKKEKLSICNKCDDKGEPGYIPREECECQKKANFAIEAFCLEGKITKEHASEIEEILETFLEQANRAGAKKMLKFIADDQGWEESEEVYRNKIDEILKIGS